jgi:cell division protein FtsB
MRALITILIGILIVLQITLWVGRGGVRDVRKLEHAVADQQAAIAALKERNRTLSAEVMDLKQGLEAVEELARSEMGMIKKDEQFFRVIDQPSRVVSSEDSESSDER